MDREKLVEAMARAAAEAAHRMPWSNLPAMAKEQWCECMRAALAVAEPVVREWCAEVADARVSSIGTRTENGTARIIAAAIRTGGTP